MVPVQAVVENVKFAREEVVFRIHQTRVAEATILVAGMMIRVVRIQSVVEIRAVEIRVVKIRVVKIRNVAEIHAARILLIPLVPALRAVRAQAVVPAHLQVHHRAPAAVHHPAQVHQAVQAQAVARAGGMIVLMTRVAE